MVEFESIPVTRLHNVVVKALEERILTGAIKPGEMLPPEKDLSQQLNVGRRAVREALRILQNKGLVEIRMGVGTVVLRNDLDSYLDTLLENMNSYLHTNQGELENVLEFRAIIESYALKRLIDSRDPAPVAELRENLADQRRALADKDPEAYNHHHILFHQRIVESLKNPIVSMVYDQVRKLIADRVFVAGRTADQQKKSIAEHTAIVDAVAAGDWMACDLAIKQHLSLAYRNLKSVG